MYWRPAAAARRGFKMVLFTLPSEHLCRRYMRSTECPSSCCCSPTFTVLDSHECDSRYDRLTRSDDRLRRTDRSVSIDQCIDVHWLTASHHGLLSVSSDLHWLTGCHFYRAMRMHSADYAVAKMSIRSSVCLSVTCRWCTIASHTSALISVWLVLSETPSHTARPRVVPVYSQAYAGTHCAFPRTDG